MSKFPSIEEIDQDIDIPTSSSAAPDSGDFIDFSNEDASAPAPDDFLTREKALLGDDAKEFETSDDAKVKSAPDEISEFKASFPALDTTAPTTTTSNTTTDAPEDASSSGISSGVKSLSLEDSQAIKEWRERQALEIQRRDQLSETKRQETREAAKANIDDFYENYANKKDSLIEKVRAEEKTFIDERDNSVVGTTWDRIAKLIDTSNKGAKSEISDKSRFRDVLLSLKGNPDAPGAAGY
ncbi:uncharacterized protein SAPINGB_P003544 [Magnusiomyces paraingens]|uniref:Clathrin light chain n=1 Tax=Magnusiomyces paraingens TaxID=2606893 RepID=A0A5E8BS62_9ASCO|nr:uncharacterized protein SAPINGB_P003544 [Saprochaete ingens]VVT53379.1 unnamed protein product [Saprochaete ingens]